MNTNANELRDERAPIFYQYPGQTNPQPAFIEIDPENESLRADYSGEIGNGQPIAVWHRRKLRIEIPHDVSGNQIADFLEDEDTARLAELIFDGYECIWDGSNHIGRYSDEAEAAIEQLTEAAYNALQYPENEIWVVAEWMEACTYPTWDADGDPISYSIDGIGEILSDTPDDEISLMASAIDSLADDESVVFSDSADEWLTELRDSIPLTEYED